MFLGNPVTVAQATTIALNVMDSYYYHYCKYPFADYVYNFGLEWLAAVVQHPHEELDMDWSRFCVRYWYTQTIAALIGESIAGYNISFTHPTIFRYVFSKEEQEEQNIDLVSDYYKIQIKTVAFLYNKQVGELALAWDLIQYCDDWFKGSPTHFSIVDVDLGIHSLIETKTLHGFYNYREKTPLTIPLIQKHSTLFFDNSHIYTHHW